VLLPMRRNAPSPTELRIAVGLRRRDPEAMRALCTEYGPSALALLRNTIADRCAVEDVFQQVLLEAWLRCPSYDPARASLRTWLKTIARSRAIDHMRRRIPETYDPTDPRNDWPTDGEAIGALIDRLTIEGLVRQLPPLEADVLRLQYHLGFSQRQVVAQTGVPLGTVKSRTASALRHLRSMLDEQRTPH
jgi:RNA polymerase sigma-70 factor (ECF subfamily)